MHRPNAAILLSGGMDSIATAFWKRPRFAFTVNYGQKPAKSEIHAAMQISNYLGMEHHIINVDCSAFGSGDLHGSQPLSIAPISEWWPYRNQLLITLACMKGIALGITELIVGAVSSDIYHKDGTKKFYDQISRIIEYQEGNISINYPAIKMTTVELIKKSGIPHSLLFWAHSCHTSNQPCMMCNGCNKFLYTIQELGIEQ